MLIKFFQKNIFAVLILQAVFLSFFLFFKLNLPTMVSAQEEPVNCLKKISVVARNSNGDYISNASFNIYRQVMDVDGKPKPGTKVASGKINAITGRGEVSFRDQYNDVYALEIWTEAKAHFYFYGDISLSCAYEEEEELEVTEYLSALKIVLRDATNNLLKNYAFSLYSQRYDADGKPIKEKQDLIGNYNSSEEGEALIYLPSSARSIDGNGASYYVFESNQKENGIYRQYDIFLSDANTTELEYVFSDAKLILKNFEGVAFPANTKIEIYQQDQDEEGEKILGDFVKNVYTNDNGEAIFKYPQGIYVAKLSGDENSEQYFWDLEVLDGQRTEYELKTDESWKPSKENCQAESTLNLSVKDLDGNYIPGLKYELYEQISDANGQAKLGDKILSGIINDLGDDSVVFHPNPLKKYALKVYDKNTEPAAFYFFDALRFFCGEDKKTVKNLPSLKVVLRNGDNSLKKNHKFSIYSQKYDADGKPIKEKKDLIVANLSTSEKGYVNLFLAPQEYAKDGHGLYVFNSYGENKTIFEEYNIKPSKTNNYTFQYVFSDLLFKLKNASNDALKKKTIALYRQEKDIDKNYKLAKKIISLKTDDNGMARIEHPAGRFALVLKDDLGQDNIFWNIRIKNQQRNIKEIYTNLTRIQVIESKNLSLGKKTAINIYSLKKKSNTIFYKNKKLKTLKLDEHKQAQLSLSPGPYLFTITVGKNKLEYGQAVYAENNKKQDVIIKINKEYLINNKSEFSLKEPVRPITLSERLSGYILLQVEDMGKAWYVNPSDEKRYYMKNGESAYQIMRRFGLGISNENLSKIPIGINDRFEDYDYDGDLVSDKMEEAIGTDMYLADTDRDGYDDGVEIKNNYNPLGNGKQVLDYQLTNKLKGKILLQVESRGEAWYLNPKDGRRYYMKDGESAYQIMKFLSLGIKNIDLEQIELGDIN